MWKILVILIVNIDIDQFSATYDNLILLVDFNVEPEEVNMLDFLNIYNLKNLVKQKTCYKNPENPSYIDLVLTNSHRSSRKIQTLRVNIYDNFENFECEIFRVLFLYK